MTRISDIDLREFQCLLVQRFGLIITRTIELQTLMVEVLRKFRLGLAPNTGTVIPAAAGVLAPVVEGEIDKGKQLPLLISLL